MYFICSQSPQRSCSSLLIQAVTPLYSTPTRSPRSANQLLLNVPETKFNLKGLELLLLQKCETICFCTLARPLPRLFLSSWPLTPCEMLTLVALLFVLCPRYDVPYCCTALCDFGVYERHFINK